jgi:hypothetical protein
VCSFNITSEKGKEKRDKGERRRKKKEENL